MFNNAEMGVNRIAFTDTKTGLKGIKLQNATVGLNGIMFKNTSAGFHTFMKSSGLIKGETTRLILDDFKRYNKRAACFKIRKIPGTNSIFLVEYKKGIKSYGVTWLIKFTTSPTGFKYRGVDMIINPQLLLGDGDLTTISNETHLDRIANAYNNLAKQISTHLPLFGECSTVRTDPCLNFDMQELMIDCDQRQMLNLLRRADIPRGFKEHLERDSVGHRNKGYGNSFYLVSEFIDINIYWKQEQLRDKHPDKIEDIKRAEYVIRFEAHCKYDKMYHEKKKILAAAGGTKLGNFDIDKQLLADAETIPAAIGYYRKVVTMGDYYTLKKAIKLVESVPHLRTQRRERIIETLNLVSKHRGIGKAREHLQDEKDVNNFDWSIQDLSALGINPVTIPRRWKIKYIPNLLKRYEEMASQGLR